MASSSITLTAGVRQNLLSLQQTGALSATTQNRLATGKKVNSALDNPTNFFTSSSLNSRASDLSSLLDSMSNGIKVLEAADNALTAITKTVESAQSTLRQARQDKSFKSLSYDIASFDPNAASGGKLTFTGGAFTTATQFDLTTTGSGKYVQTAANYAVPAAAATATTASAAAIDLSATNVTAGKLTIGYQGTSVTIDIAGGTASATLAADTAAEINAALVGTALEGKITAADDGDDGVILTGLANQDGTITVSGTSEASIFGVEQTTAGSDAKSSFSVNGTTVTLERATTGASLTAAIDETNRVLSAAGLKFQAYDASGKLGIRATSTESGALAISGADASLFGTPTNGIVAGSTSASLKLAQGIDSLVSSINADASLKTFIRAANDNGKLRIENLSTAELTVTGATASKATGLSTDTSQIGGNDVRKSLVKQFNDLRDQLDKLADDASYNGINLLRGDKLKITFNENGSSAISIQAEDADGNATTISAARLGITDAIASEFDNDDSIDARLDTLSSALTTLRSQLSAFGSNLSVVQNRQDFTKATITTLQTGADNLVLADTNEEGANLLALQTRQQLSTTALSLANQANQAVLRLF